MSGSTQLANQVVKVIDSVQKMDFHLGGLPINVDGLGRVAHAIQKGDIEVAQDTHLAPDAQYDAGKNALFLKSLKFGEVEFRSLIVHEAVHALIDLLKAKETRKLAGEAAAYLAQALYSYQEVGDLRFRHSVTALLSSAKEQDKQLGRIYQTCLHLIDKCKMAIPGHNPWLPPILYQPLLEAIKGHDTYKDIRWDQKVVADGIRTRGTQAAVRTQAGGLRLANARTQGPAGVRDPESPFGPCSAGNEGAIGLA
ncbi:MAG: hypothetical protein MUC88_25840 [Planctomycetes bacterium]|nr:hypothetical protein [Planctomycetota bacterium]